MIIKSISASLALAMVIIAAEHLLPAPPAAPVPAPVAPVVEKVAEPAPEPVVVVAPAPILRDTLPAIDPPAEVLPPVPMPAPRPRPLARHKPPMFIKGDVPVTQSDVAACTPDVTSLCASDILGGRSAVFTCLTSKATRSKLSAACRATLERHGV